MFKKEDPNNKANYPPFSLLPIISKIFQNRQTERDRETERGTERQRESSFRAD